MLREYDKNRVLSCFLFFFASFLFFLCHENKEKKK